MFRQTRKIRWSRHAYGRWAALCMAALAGCGSIVETQEASDNAEVSESASAVASSALLPTELTGYVPPAPYHAGKDYNRCIDGVESAFAKLNTVPETITMMRYTTSPWVNYVDFPDDVNTELYHYQSINRLPYYYDDATGAYRDLSQYVIVQTAVDSHGTPGTAQIGYATMDGSTLIAPGERLRTNRYVNDVFAPASWSDALNSNLFNPPAPVLHASDGTPWGSNSHPSGSGTLGAFLIAPFQHWDTNWFGQPVSDGGWGSIAVYDLSVLPVRNSGSPPPAISAATRFPSSSNGVNWASAVKLSDGSYLAVASTGNGLELYRSFGSLKAPGGFASNTTDPPSISSYTIASQGTDLLSSQNGQVLTECGTGALYLVTSNIGNMIRLWRLRLVSDGPGHLNLDHKQTYTAVRADGSRETFGTPLQTLTLACHTINNQYEDAFGFTDTASFCNLQKAGNAYVDPSGRLLYYGSTAGNYPDSAGYSYAPLAEFRYSDPQKVSSAPGKCDVGHAFFELYSDRLGSGTPGPSSGEPPSGTQSFIVDYVDRNHWSKTYSNDYNFGGVALAARYCIPAGYKYVMHSAAELSAWGTAGDVQRSFCGTGTGCSGNLSNGTTEGFNFAANYNWSSGCFMFAEDNANNRANCIADYGSPHSDSCALTSTARQAFQYAGMVGCAGKVTFDQRATLCGEGFHPASAVNYYTDYGAVTPSHDYWVNDALKYNGSGPGSCWVSTTTGNSCNANQPMRVCSSSVDPEGNTCNWTGCAFGSGHTESDFFGGCNGNATAGTLCVP
jgi:hypothetical protein